MGYLAEPLKLAKTKHKQEKVTILLTASIKSPVIQDIFITARRMLKFSKLSTVAGYEFGYLCRYAG